MQTYTLQLEITYTITQTLLPPGPAGFVSTSPAITSSKSIITTLALSSRVPPPPSTFTFTWQVYALQWQHTLQLPTLPFMLGQEWTKYCSISDRARTVMQHLSTRDVLFLTSPTPQPATPGWYSRPPLLLEGPTHVVVVEPNSSSPYGKIDPHDQSVAVNGTHTISLQQNKWFCYCYIVAIDIKIKIFQYSNM